MATAQQADETCSVFGDPPGELQAGAINRFVVGEDSAPRVLSQEEAAGELGDPFATLVLLKGVFPASAEQSLQELHKAAPAGDPLASHQSFIVGEASQLADLPPRAQGIRFLVATQSGPSGPDVIISAPDPAGSFVELMAWDRVSAGFNYYRTVGEAWVFAGNSRHALSDPTRNKGPFESHKSGALLMKELEFPWVHWNSPVAVTAPTVFDQGDERKNHAWFRTPQGADVLERQVAIPALKRWAQARFERIADAGGTVNDPARILTQITTTHTVNLVSSTVTSRSPEAGQAAVDLPPGFFFDVRALTIPLEGGTSLGIPDPGEFSVPLELYEASVQQAALRNENEDGSVSIPGDAHFAFVVPARAHEDQVVLEEAVARGLVSKRLAACLLMVDFPNPIFSARRQALQAFVPGSATLADGQSAFSQEMADAVLAAAPQSKEGSSEREFAQLWETGEDFAVPFGQRLADYAQQVTARLETQEGIDDYTRLATSRRERCRRDMPILRENKLVMPISDLPAAELQMTVEGAVVEIEEQA